MDAAERMLIGTPLVWGAYDLWLWSTGRRTLTRAMRHRWPFVAAFSLVLALHVADRLGPADPFNAVGRAILRVPRLTRQTDGVC
jgi:hypothetical protein